MASSESDPLTRLAEFFESWFGSTQVDAASAAGERAGWPVSFQRLLEIDRRWPNGDEVFGRFQVEDRLVSPDEWPNEQSDGLVAVALAGRHDAHWAVEAADPEGAVYFNGDEVDDAMSPFQGYEQVAPSLAEFLLHFCVVEVFHSCEVQVGGLNVWAAESFDSLGLVSGSDFHRIEIRRDGGVLVWRREQWVGPGEFQAQYRFACADDQASDELEGHRSAANWFQIQFAPRIWWRDRCDPRTRYWPEWAVEINEVGKVTLSREDPRIALKLDVVVSDFLSRVDAFAGQQDQLDVDKPKALSFCNVRIGPPNTEGQTRGYLLPIQFVVDLVEELLDAATNVSDADRATYLELFHDVADNVGDIEG